MDIKKELVNNTQIRYLCKDSIHWVVLCDLAAATNISPLSISRYIAKNKNVDSRKVVLEKSNAFAVPAELALNSLNNLLSGSIWKRKLDKNKTFRNSIQNAIAFLEQIQNHTVPAYISIRFVGTAQNPSWVAVDVVAALYPNDGKTNYHNRLKKVSDKWKSKKRINSNGISTEVITLCKSGVDELLELSKSPRAEEVKEWMSEQVEVETELLEDYWESAEGESAIKPIKLNFMDHEVRFVGTPEIPEWVTLDILQILYPEANKQEYASYLAKIDSRWQDSVTLYIDGKEQIVRTIYKPGLFDLVGRSGSPVAQPLRERILEQLDFVTSQNSDMPANEINMEPEDVASELLTQEVITPTDFDYMGQIIRFIGTKDKPEWVAADVVKALYPDAKKKQYHLYLAKVGAEQKGRKKITTLGGPQTVTTLLEPGLYQLTARSDSPIAKPFQKWLYEEVLPSIRKTGNYTAPGKMEKILIGQGTFTGDIDKLAQFVQQSLDATNLPLPIKSLCLVRTLREAFPDRKEFDILSQTLATQYLTPYSEHLTFRTYHNTTDLGIVYASKHKLPQPIDRQIIYKALIDKNLIERDGDRNWVPTESGKYYCAMGWHLLDDGTKRLVLQWKQETLLVLGTLH
ncbi:MAG: hypothetical protein HC815_05665 [Richelia sp. RM1_1_1]|nr:hypothetical protein [Richelia sp. RM1_1_1]